MSQLLFALLMPEDDDEIEGLLEVLLGAEGRTIDEDRVGDPIDLVHEEGEDLILLVGRQLLLIDDMDVSFVKALQEVGEGAVEEG